MSKPNLPQQYNFGIFPTMPTIPIARPTPPQTRNLGPVGRPGRGVLKKPSNKSSEEIAKEKFQSQFKIDPHTGEKVYDPYSTLTGSYGFLEFVKGVRDFNDQYTQKSKPLPSKVGKKPSKNSNNSKVKDIQTILQNAGFYNGKIDGILGKNTRQGIKDFQQMLADNGFYDVKVDGIWGRKTVEGLQHLMKAKEDSERISSMPQISNDSSKGLTPVDSPMSQIVAGITGGTPKDYISPSTNLQPWW